MPARKPNVTAIIYDKRGRVLAIGKNSYSKSHTLQAKHAAKVGLPEKIYLHAEIDAIIRCKDLSKAYSVQVIRKDKQGRSRMAKPCPICMSAIESVGIENISWTTN